MSKAWKETFIGTDHRRTYPRWISIIFGLYRRHPQGAGYVRTAPIWSKGFWIRSWDRLRGGPTARCAMSDRRKRKPKRTEYMQGFLDGMEYMQGFLGGMNRASEHGQQVEGDCGDVEHLSSSTTRTSVCTRMSDTLESLRREHLIGGDLDWHPPETCWSCRALAALERSERNLEIVSAAHDDEERDNDLLHERSERLEKALREIANWSQTLQDRGHHLEQWRGCVAIARAALEEGRDDS